MEARKIILDYINRYEEIYLQHEGPETEARLSEATDEYHKRMSKLAEEANGLRPKRLVLPSNSRF